MNKLRRGIGILLITIGVVIIAVTAYRKVVTNQRQKQLIEIFENQITEGESGGQVKLEDINGHTPIAIIEIPSIKLTQALVEGVSDDVLQFFLGHFPDSAKPGEKGNFSVAGHRVSDYADAFINLYKVKVGDEVVVKTETEEFIYVIKSTFIVEPTAVSVLDDTEGATITLITCTVGAKQRVIVKGTLKSSRKM